MKQQKKIEKIDIKQLNKDLIKAGVTIPFSLKIQEFAMKINEIRDAVNYLLEWRNGFTYPASELQDTTEEEKMHKCSKCGTPSETLTLKKAIELNAVGGRCYECVRKDNHNVGPTKLKVQHVEETIGEATARNKEWFDRGYTQASPPTEESWEKEFDNEFYEYQTYSKLENFKLNVEAYKIKEFISGLLQKEKEAWINSERCTLCGTKKLQDPTSNFCEKCWEEA